MLALSKRFIYALSNKIRHTNPESVPKSKLIVNFAGKRKSPFDIKSESSYNAYLSKGSLALGLKKSNCIAWVEIPGQEFIDHIIEAKIRIDSLGGYASTGIAFRITGQDSYYLALVSSKGYFRIDAVKDNSPTALIAWTEISDFNGTDIDLGIFACDTSLIFIVNGKWVGEANDSSISAGRLGFALVSYETKDVDTNKYTCKAWLDYFYVDTRLKILKEKYKKWTCDSSINAEGRLRLAETFAVMGKHSKALEQLKKVWKRRDEVISGIVTTYTEARTKKELLLAARMSFNTGQYNEAEEYIDSILEQWPDSAEGKLAHTEKLRVLNELNKFAELKEFVSAHPDINKDIDYYTTLARCHWELKEYKDSAKAWKKAFDINSENGVFAVNAANALEMTGKRKEALALYLEAGKLFLGQDNSGELAAMMPKLTSLGGKNWEARALSGKWLFSIEDYNRCETEFAAAEKLRCALKPRPKADPALYYLWGMALSVKGRNRGAVRLLERAVKLAPDYELFSVKLNELKQAQPVKTAKR